jgi:hypothetical protein
MLRKNALFAAGPDMSTAEFVKLAGDRVTYSLLSLQ